MRETDAYFRFLAQRAQRHAGSGTVLRITVCGYRVRLVFAGLVPPDLMKRSLGWLTDREGGEAEETADVREDEKADEAACVREDEETDETVYIWEDDLALLKRESMIPEEKQSRKYHRTETFDILFPGMTQRLAVRDSRSRVTWVCFAEGGGIPWSYMNKPFVNELQWWLRDRFFLLHGGMAGTGGTGALILGPSGAGKSTLAMACLSAGMDYAAEDYVLISKTGGLAAEPVFQTGYLTPYSLEKLPDLTPYVLQYAEEKGKYLLDLQAFRNRFRSMRPEMIVYPHPCGCASPAFVRAQSVPSFMAALTSTARQIKSQQFFTDAFMGIFHRLKDLPAYEMRLTEDPLKNADALKQFLSRREDTR